MTITKEDEQIKFSVVGLKEEFQELIQQIERVYALALSSKDIEEYSALFRFKDNIVLALQQEK